MLGSIIGGALGFLGADKAADAQVSAANKAADVQWDMYNDTVNRLSPYANAGLPGLDAYLYEIGLGPRPRIGGQTYNVEEMTRTIPGSSGSSNAPDWRANYLLRNSGGSTSTEGPNAGGSGSREETYWSVNGREFGSQRAAQKYADKKTKKSGTRYKSQAPNVRSYEDIYNNVSELSPGAQFALTQGRNTMEAGAAGRGNLWSGSTAQGLEEFRFGLAAQDRENLLNREFMMRGQEVAERDAYLNRLLGVSQIGQSAAGGLGTAGQNLATNVGNAYTQAGNASAAGIVGGVNAITGAMDNYTANQQYNKLLDRINYQ